MGDLPHDYNGGTGVDVAGKYLCAFNATWIAGWKVHFLWFVCGATFVPEYLAVLWMQTTFAQQKVKQLGWAV